MKKSVNTLIVIVAALLAMAAGFWLSSTRQPGADATVEQVQGFHGTRLSVPRKLAIPVLQKTDHGAFTAADITGHWSLLFFGYTNCPDVCPTTMRMLAAAKLEAPDGFPRVFFVSVDPQRDKLEQLAQYVKYFDDDFTGVTGDEKMLQALALQADVLFMKVPAEAGSDNAYLVDHSAAILAINPEGRLAAFINPPHTPDSILKAIDVLMNNE